MNNSMTSLQLVRGNMDTLNSRARKSKLVDAAIDAARSVGEDGSGKDELVGYLKFLAIHHPKVFVKLLGNTLPRPSPKQKRRS